LHDFLAATGGASGISASFSKTYGGGVCKPGHKIDARGDRPDPKKCRTISQMPPPTSVTEIRAFLGLIGYYRRFISNFSEIAKPLNCLLSREQPWEWSQVQQQAFMELKNYPLMPPILKRPDFGEPFILQTDWCREAIALCSARCLMERNTHLFCKQKPQCCREKLFCI